MSKDATLNLSQGTVIMPQAQNSQSSNPSTHTQKALTVEQAAEIARKSHLRLQAQTGQANISRQSTSFQPAITQNNSQQRAQAPNPPQHRGNVQMPAVRPNLSTQSRPIASPQRVSPQAPPMPEDTSHLNKDGSPDRRYEENRGSVAPPAMKRRDSVGMHLTKSGTPDRRYLENQHMSPREAEIEKAKQILRNAGIKSVD